MHVPSISLIIYAVPTIFATPKKEMRRAAREGRMKQSAYSVAFCCSWRITEQPLREIVKQFAFRHYDSGSDSGSGAKYDRHTNDDYGKFNAQGKNIKMAS